MVSGSLTKLYLEPLTPRHAALVAAYPTSAAHQSSRIGECCPRLGRAEAVVIADDTARVMTAASTASRRRPEGAMDPAMMGAPLVLLLVVFLVYPVGQLLLLSFYMDEPFSLAHYRQLFSSSVYVDVLLITLKISLLTTLLSVIAGYPIAYLISMVGKERKTTLLFWVLLSFWTSFLVRASRGSCCSAATA